MNQAPKFPYCWAENDELPELVCTLLDTDLTTFTSITLHMQRPDGTVLVKPATGIDLTQGHFKFAWSAGDLQKGFNQPCEVQFINASGQPSTGPKFLIDVRGEIA